MTRVDENDRKVLGVWKRCTSALTRSEIRDRLAGTLSAAQVEGAVARLVAAGTLEQMPGRPMTFKPRRKGKA